jgi:hypothetical protein
VVDRQRLSTLLNTRLLNAVVKAATNAGLAVPASRSSSDRRIDELWGDAPPATAAKTVQVYVSQLRKVLHGGGGEGPLLDARPRPRHACGGSVTPRF